MSDLNFNEGDKVAVIQRDCKSIRKSVVDRVYKTGNFTLRHDSYRGQYRQTGCSAGDDWSWVTIEHWTEAHRDAMLLNRARANLNRGLLSLDVEALDAGQCQRLLSAIQEVQA